MSETLPKLKRPLRKVVKNCYQVLKINTQLQEEIQVLNKGVVPRDSKSLTIGVWNIFKGNGGVKFFRDFMSIVKSCDLWMLQEVLASPHGLGDYIPDHYEGFHGASYERMDGLRDGVMNLARLESGEFSKVFRFSKTEPLVRTPKVSLMNHYYMGKRNVRVINVHQPLVRGRKRASRDLLEVMEQADEFEGPGIVAGDFNTFTKRYFREVCQVMTSFGYEYVPLDHDPRKEIQKLDHIFQRGFKVESSSIIKEAKSSDHFALRAKLLLED